MLDEFHPVTLAIPLLLFAFVFLEEDRRWLAVPFLVLAALCKEEIPLVIALMGLYFALRKRTLWPLLITAAGGAVLPAGRRRRASRTSTAAARATSWTGTPAARRACAASPRAC